MKIWLLALLAVLVCLNAVAVRVADKFIDQPQDGQIFVAVEDTELHYDSNMLLNSHQKVGELSRGDQVRISSKHQIVVNRVQTARVDYFWRTWYRVGFSGTRGGGAWVLAQDLKKIK